MIFHVLNAAHKLTHAIQADGFHVAQSQTTAGHDSPSQVHTVFQFYDRVVTEHWHKADAVDEVVVAQIKTSKDYTVIASHAIERPAPKPSTRELQRLAALQQNIAGPGTTTGMTGIGGILGVR